MSSSSEFSSSASTSDGSTTDGEWESQFPEGGFHPSAREHIRRRSNANEADEVISIESGISNGSFLSSNDSVSEAEEDAGVQPPNANAVPPLLQVAMPANAGDADPAPPADPAPAPPAGPPAADPAVHDLQVSQQCIYLYCIIITTITMLTSIPLQC